MQELNDSRQPTFAENDPKYPVIKITVWFDTASGQLRTNSNCKDLNLVLMIMLEASHALINAPKPAPPAIHVSKEPLGN